MVEVYLVANQVDKVNSNSNNHQTFLEVINRQAYSTLQLNQVVAVICSVNPQQLEEVVSLVAVDSWVRLPL